MPCAYLTQALPYATSEKNLIYREQIVPQGKNKINYN